MNVIVNGTPTDLADGTTVERAVLDSGAARERGTAAALNGEVVPRSSWAETELSDGDRLEVLVAIGGG